MRTKALIILIWFLLTPRIVSGQENDDVEIACPPEMANIINSCDNKPIANIYCGEDNLFYRDQKSCLSFDIQVDIWRTIGSNGLDELLITKIEGAFVNGKKSGRWYKGGKSAPLRVETYHDGVLDGVSRVFAYNGDMIYRTVFKKGTGYYKDYYYDNEQIFIEGKIRKGKRTGVWRTYYKDGTLKYYETYRNGLLNGKYISFDEQGNVLYSTKFSKGSGYYKSFDTKTKRLNEEGQMVNGYRIGPWIKIKYGYFPSGEDLREVIEQTPDSPENRCLHHNLIDIVYYRGKAYYINASDPKE